MNCSLDWRLTTSTPHRAKQPRETKGIHLNPKPNIHQYPNDDIPKIPIFISRKHSLNEKSLTSMKSSLGRLCLDPKPSYILSFLYFLFDQCEFQTYLRTAQSSLYFGSSGSPTAQCACRAACPRPFWRSPGTHTCGRIPSPFEWHKQEIAVLSRVIEKTVHWKIPKSKRL